MSTSTKTIWYRNKEQGTLHQVAEGSDHHRTVARALTEVDEEAGEIPEPVYERLTDAEVRKIDPSKVPGYTSPEIQAKRRDRINRANGVYIEAPKPSGPSDEEIQARIDAAVEAAVEKTLAALADKQPADPPAGSTPETSGTKQPATNTTVKK